MRLLLDTCIFLWFISGDKRLTDSIRELICNPDNKNLLNDGSGSHEYHVTPPKMKLTSRTALENHSISFYLRLSQKR